MGGEAFVEADIAPPCYCLATCQQFFAQLSDQDGGDCLIGEMKAGLTGLAFEFDDRVYKRFGVRMLVASDIIQGRVAKSTLMSIAPVGKLHLDPFAI